MSLKQKTISGLIWSFIENFSRQSITFVVGIILARLLSPEEFGLVGMVTIFIAVSASVVNSGFSQALIRKKDCTDVDYSTVFYFNMISSIVLSVVLFFASPLIADFFEESQLEMLVKVLASVLIIDAFSIIQRTKLTKRIDFKLQTKISLISDVVSGILGIAMAYAGFGVWCLVAKQIVQKALNALLLWFFNRWMPLFVFSKKSFNELFSFGSRLLISGLIDTFYKNIYLLVIAKFFSAADLGFYTRANQFKKMPSQNMTTVIQRVTYPVLASIQDDKARLKKYYQTLIRSTMLITFVVMLGMAAIAEPMIIVLIGEKWRPSIVYLQMLCFIGMMYPLHSLNLNMLKVSGRSDLFLKLEIIKRSLAIPIVVVGIFLGIKIMIFGMMINSIVAYYLNSYWSGQFVGYSIREQVKDIWPSFILALLMAATVYMLGIVLPFSYLPLLFVQLLAGAGFVFLFCEIIKFDDYIAVKKIALEKWKDIKKQ